MICVTIFRPNRIYKWKKRFQITEPPTLRASYLFHPIRDIFTSFLFIGKKGGVVFQQLIVVLCHLQPQRHMEITSFVPWYDMHVPSLHTTTGTRGLSFQESFNEQCAASYSSCEVRLGSPDPSSSVKKSYKLGACVVWLSQFSCNTSISYWSATSLCAWGSRGQLQRLGTNPSSCLLLGPG